MKTLRHDKTSATVSGHLHALLHLHWREQKNTFVHQGYEAHLESFQGPTWRVTARPPGSVTVSEDELMERSLGLCQQPWRGQPSSAEMGEAAPQCLLRRIDRMFNILYVCECEITSPRIGELLTDRNTEDF